jgi:hypothetical protein
MVPRRAPSALIATAAWVRLWVSTPMMMSVLVTVSLMLCGSRPDGRPDDRAGGQNCDGMDALKLL